MWYVKVVEASPIQVFVPFSYYMILKQTNITAFNFSDYFNSKDGNEWLDF